MSNELAQSSRRMARAFRLARAALGTTSPNPAVGAVLELDGRVIGEGATSHPADRTRRWSRCAPPALQRAGQRCT